MKVNREAILDALTLVQPGLAGKEIIEQSQSFIFKDGRVMTYNDEIAVSCPVPQLQAINGAVKAEELIKLLNKLKVKELEVEFKENELSVKSKSAKAGITMESEISLAVDEIGIPKKKDWIDLPKNFVEGLKFCMFSASTDSTKPVLTCLRLKGKYITSCDNYRLTKFDMGKKGKVAFAEEVLLPSRAAKELIRHKAYQIAVTGSWVHFKIGKVDGGDVVFSCRGLKGKYPNVKKLLDVEGFEITLPEKTKAILDRAGIFASGDFNQDTQVELTLKDGKMHIFGKGDAGWFKERTKIDYDGKEFSFVIHPEFLSDTLDLLNKVTVGEGALKLEGEKFVHVVCLIAS